MTAAVGGREELAEVKRRAMRLVDQVAYGDLSGAAMKDRLDLLEQRRSELKTKLAAASSEPELVLHPAASACYHQVVERLGDVLARPGRRRWPKRATRSAH